MIDIETENKRLYSILLAVMEGMVDEDYDAYKGIDALLRAIRALIDTDTDEDMNRLGILYLFISCRYIDDLFAYSSMFYTIGNVCMLSYTCDVDVDSITLLHDVHTITSSISTSISSSDSIMNWVVCKDGVRTYGCIPHDTLLHINMHGMSTDILRRIPDVRTCTLYVHRVSIHHTHDVYDDDDDMMCKDTTLDDIL